MFFHLCVAVVSQLFDENGGRVDSQLTDENQGGTRKPRALFGHNQTTTRSTLRRRLKKAGIGFLTLLVVAVVSTSLISVPYEAITPGSTVSVANLITVPKNHRHTTRGSVSLVDVNVIALRAITYLIYRLNGDDQVIPNGQILGTESQSTYNEQGVLDMLTAQQAATYVALHQLGYQVTTVPSGIAVYATEPNSPAAKGQAIASLNAGDLILSIDGHAVTSATSIHNVLIAHHPGDRVDLTVRLYGAKHTRHVPLSLGALITKGGNAQCDVVATANAIRQARTSPACIGVDLTQLYSVAHQPFSVNLNAEGIIGPSAGLAFTLGLMKVLDPANMTAGLKIAATGTMSLDGSVGDVGGVAQKTIAVRNSGATVFFVPQIEYSVAKAHAGPHLRIFPVTTIAQVVRDLEGLGGRIVKEYPR